MNSHFREMGKSRTLWLLLGILIIASFLRLHQIKTIPPGLNPDEAVDGNYALEAVRTGKFHVFPANREGLFINIQALFLAIFGVNEPWVLRLPSAIFGILTVLGIYFLAKELFSQRIGLLSAFLLATSFWHINFSRIGFRAILAPFFLTWSLYFLIRALKTNSSRYSLLAGILFGLGFYTYIAYRFAPALVLLVLAYYWLEARQGRWQKRFLRSAAPFVLVSILVAAPLGYYFLTHPGSFSSRTSEISIFRSGTPVKDLTINILKTAAMFNFGGDYNWRHNIAGRAELFWPVGILFILGLTVCLKTLLQSAKRAMRSYGSKAENTSAQTSSETLELPVSILLLFAWFALAMAPVVFSETVSLPHALRSILLIPPTIMLAAVGGESLSKFLQNRGRPSLLCAVIIIFLGLLALEAYTSYFILWAGNAATAGAFNTNDVLMGKIINGLPREIPKYVVVEDRRVLVRGIPLAAQTVMFITDTFSPENQKAKNMRYLLPGEENIIPAGAIKFTLKYTPPHLR